MRMIETPEDMRLLMHECVELTHNWVDRCNRAFGIHLPEFRVEFGLKGTTAGKAFINKGLIKYNPTLLRENPEQFLAQTVGHEVIHHAAYAVHGMGISGHGQEWKIMMRKMGLLDRVCHSYDTSNVPTKVGKSSKSIISNRLGRSIGSMRNIAGGNIIEFED